MKNEEKDLKYFDVLNQIYFEQSDGKILPQKRLKEIFLEHNASPVMGTCLYRGLDFVKWDGESWRWLVDKPTIKHAKKLHDFFLHDYVILKGTQREKNEAKRFLKALIKVREISLNDGVKSHFIHDILKNSRVKLTTSILESNNFITTIKVGRYYGGCEIFKWNYDNELILQDCIYLSRKLRNQSQKIKRVKSKEINPNQWVALTESEEIQNYRNFIIDLTGKLQLNKRYMKNGIANGISIDFSKLCQLYNVSESVVYILSKPYPFNWLKIVNGFYIWDHTYPCSKKDTERIYKAVTFYDNKNKN